MVATLKIRRKLNQKIIKRSPLTRRNLTNLTKSNKVLNTNYHELSINGYAQQLYEKLYGNYMLKEKICKI